LASSRWEVDGSMWRHMVEEQSFLLPDEEILTVLTLPQQAIAH
jgi:hypothetical protein